MTTKRQLALRLLRLARWRVQAESVGGFRLCQDCADELRRRGQG